MVINTAENGSPFLNGQYRGDPSNARVCRNQNDRVCGLPDLPGFVENRGDQSILSLLAHKYRLHTFRGAGGQAVYKSSC